MRHAVFIGSNGQLGTDLTPAPAEFRLIGLRRADIVNTSAYHQLDEALANSLRAKGHVQA